MAEPHCHHPDCAWLALPNLTDLRGLHVPKLYPEPELSGIGVILGFSLIAYLTLALLFLHYICVYNPQDVASRGESFLNPVDYQLLSWIRGVYIWKPSPRFEYAMEKSMLILSDTQLVTGLAILVAGYSQLKCAISAYHWQIMVYVAWFASFTFLSAMAFLQGYFQTNSSLRIFRSIFMVLLASLLVVALLPTGSRNWLDLADEGGGFYPSLSASCYYKQLGMSTFSHGTSKTWSMALSEFVVVTSYVHGIIRLFDPSAKLTRKYLRLIPGFYIKSGLHILEQRATKRNATAVFWFLPYIFWFAGFTLARAFSDILGSMLMEIVWLFFAIAWGTIKIYTTRNSAQYNSQGEDVNANPEVLEENSWSFGQTLPLVLLLLPMLSMAQTYLDNEAKEHGVRNGPSVNTPENHTAGPTPVEPNSRKLNSVAIDRPPVSNAQPSRANSTSCPCFRCPHHTSEAPSRSGSPGTLSRNTLPSFPSSAPYSQSGSQPSPMMLYHPPFPCPQLPLHPYAPFHSYPWYTDLLLYLVLQVLWIIGFILWVLTQIAGIFGISVVFRSRLILIWVLAMVPLGSAVLLGFWFIAGSVLRIWERMTDREERQVNNGDSSEDPGQGKEEERVGAQIGSQLASEEAMKKRRTTHYLRKVTYRILRLGLVCGVLVFTFFLSVELAGPHGLVFG